MFNQVRTTHTPLKIMQAHIQRRTRLWMQIKTDNPAYTEAQIEARLEQFGA